MTVLFDENTLPISLIIVYEVKIMITTAIVISIPFWYESYHGTMIILSIYPMSKVKIGIK